ncbi:MAG: polymerase sigma factor [Pedosphaera sp.]|nr:polymerase sigma factor [Pedosphaera sp.]
MMTTEQMPAPQQNDVGLVAESLEGNQDAFRQIVERYQNLICSLAYCATGSVSQSEDLAQETFVTAWKQLAELREPSKLRSWLCGIVRFLIGKQLRRQGREPAHAAEPMEAMDQSTAPEPLPSNQAISNEERVILWRSLERVPEIYREPLVLFYREHQSVERVAEALDLSEDAVKQRLSRGRKLLQEEFLAFVEGALARTNPGKAFTLGVLAALPAMTISAKAAALGAAAAKGGAAVKGAGLIGLLGAFLTPLLAFYGMWADYRMKQKEGHSHRELKLLKGYYLGIVISVIGVVSIIWILMSYGGSLIKTNPALFAGSMIGLILGYGLVLGAFARWFVRAVKKLPAELIPAQIAAKPKRPVWEYRSRFQLLGLPFIHIRFGGWVGVQRFEWLTARKQVKAWIAVSDACSFGVLFAYGGLAIAPISFGACAIGLFSCGAMTVGGLALGGFAFGIWALGPFAVGWQAFGGGCAIAWNAAWGGHYAVAHHFALGEIAHAAQANNEFVEHLLLSNSFFRFCRANVTSAYMIGLIWVWVIPIMISTIVQGWARTRKQSRQQSTGY